MAMTGMTDNAGNQFALARLMSSKFPLIIILTELAAQMRERRLELALEWIPRGQNEEADALTNDRLDAFDATKEVRITLEELPWIVLPTMLKIADHLYAAVRERRAGPREAQATAGRQAGGSTGRVGRWDGGRVGWARGEWRARGGPRWACRAPAPEATTTRKAQTLRQRDPWG